MTVRTWSRTLTVLSLSVFALAGCNPKDEGGSSIQGLLEDYLEFLCGCYVDAGQQPSVEQCISEAKDAFYNSDQAAYFDCLEDFASSTPSAKDSFDCAIAAYKDFQNCQQALGCEAAVGEGGDDEFECADGSTSVPQDWVCDDFEDCADASDEADCMPFVCTDGSEVQQSWVCDGFEDCMDGGDESDCPVTCESSYEIAVESCPQLTEEEQAKFNMSCSLEG